MQHGALSRFLAECGLGRVHERTKPAVAALLSQISLQLSVILDSGFAFTPILSLYFTMWSLFPSLKSILTAIINWWGIFATPEYDAIIVG